jgi:alcohol dehydrogenase class IV
VEVENELDLRKFVAPEFVYGAGARLLAGRYAKNYGARKVLVVTDPGVIQEGWTGQVTSSLEALDIPYIVYSQVTSNPRSEEVMAGARICKNEGCNIIVAVGGGSPMDCAKGIGIVSSNDKDILEFAGVDQVSSPGLPLICVPTTAGSSADVSQFAIITDTARKIKLAIISKAMVPDAALIDPVTTITMDAGLTANTGMDAFAHAVEAFASNAHSPITDLHALEAIRLIAANLREVIKSQKDIGLRGQMMLASLHAGLAFSNASLGAVHAMAHSLGGLLDLPHGESNAILLEYVIDFNYEAAPERYNRIAQAMGLQLKRGEEKEMLISAIRQLRLDAGINQTLGQLGMKHDDIPELAEEAMQDACMVTNPRRPTLLDVEVIYEKAL